MKTKMKMGWTLAKMHAGEIRFSIGTWSLYNSKKVKVGENKEVEIDVISSSNEARRIKFGSEVLFPVFYNEKDSSIFNEKILRVKNVTILPETYKQIVRLLEEYDNRNRKYE